MPVYEYQCKQCQREFEYEQRMSDPEKTVCESCGGALERLISRTAFHLKGGGWYKDLYSSAKPDKPADSKPSDGGTTPAATPTAPAAAAPASGASSSGASSGGTSSSGSGSGGTSSSGSSSGGTGAS